MDLLLSVCLVMSRILVHAEKMVKKKPVLGALPMLHMPKKSNASNKLPKRPYRSIVNEILPPDVEEVKQYIYKNFKEFCVRVSKIKTLPKWKISQLNDRMLFQLYSESLNLSLPKFEIIIDDSLGFTVSSFGWLLSETIRFTLIIEGQYEMLISLI